MKKPRGIPFGHDFAGTIAAIGQDVPQHRYIGERVAGFINGCMYISYLMFQAIGLESDHQLGISLEIGGAFAEYCLADAQVLIKLPDSLSFEDAAGLGLAGMTACQALWQNQKLPTPHEPMSDPFPVRSCPALCTRCHLLTYTWLRRFSSGEAHPRSASTQSSWLNYLG